MGDERGVCVNVRSTDGLRYCVCVHTHTCAHFQILDIRYMYTVPAVVYYHYYYPGRKTGIYLLYSNKLMYKLQVSLIDCCRVKVSSVECRVSKSVSVKIMREYTNKFTAPALTAH